MWGYIIISDVDFYFIKKILTFELTARCIYFPHLSSTTGQYENIKRGQPKVLLSENVSCYVV